MKCVSNQQTNIFMADSEEACEAAFNEMLDVAKQIGMESWMSMEMLLIQN